MSEVLRLVAEAWAADKISTIAAAFAAVLVFGYGGLLRGRGIEGRFIVEVFGYCATLATIPKLVLWGAAVLRGEQPTERPSGTDCVLMLGGLLAIAHATVQGLGDAMGAASASQSAFERWRLRLGLGLGPSTPAAETANAQRDRAEAAPPAVSPAPPE